MSKKIIVIGSITIDTTVYTRLMPSPGTTVNGDSIFKNIGGKGANQAYASTLLGGDVYFFGAVGNDSEGNMIKEFLTKSKLRFDLKTSNKPTAAAFITVNEINGENQIVVVKGANGDIFPEDIDDEIFKDASYLLIQLETPVPTVLYVLRKAHEQGITTILNPAPYNPLPEEMYQYIDYFVPNEHEIEQFVPQFDSFVDKAKHLLNKGVKNVIVTLGEKGSLLVNNNEVIEVAPHKVEAVDTTAAGDSYLGALVTALSQGKQIKEAMEFASKCSSITVTRKGAITSLPTLEEVNK